MSEIQHSTRSHARLNASSSHRWMMCPPSVKLSEQFADKPSPYAEEGTFLHELCELKLHRYLGDMTPEVLEAQYAAHRDSDFYSDEAEASPTNTPPSALRRLNPCAPPVPIR